MIKSSPLAKALSLTLSATLLVGGMQLARPDIKVEIEGGSQAVVAQMGTKFENMVAGTLTPEPVESTPQTSVPRKENAQQTEVKETSETQAQAAPEPEPQQTPVARTKAVSPSPQLQQAAQPEPSAIRSVTPVPVMTSPVADAVLPRVPLQTSSATTAPRTVLQPTPVTEASSQPSEPPLSPAEPVQTIAAQTPENTAPPTSARPKKRDPEKAEKIAAARPEPVKKRVTRKQPKQRAGNAQQNNRQGAENGTNTKTKAKTQGQVKKAGTPRLSTRPATGRNFKVSLSTTF
ncbi:MAG: hypothetical protein ABJL67_13755 [Sulfitobacter sp.]